MSKTKAQGKVTVRDCICRYCGGTIPKGEIACVLEDVHVSPKIVSLWFHFKCVLEFDSIFRKDVKKYLDEIKDE